MKGLTSGNGFLSKRLTASLVVVLLAGCADSASDSAAAAAVDTTGPAVAGAPIVDTGPSTVSSIGPSPVGDWTLNIDTPMGVSHPVLTVTEADGNYSATYEGRQGLLAIDQVEIDGNNFSFPLSITVPIGTIEVSYRGVIDGDQMTGVVQNPRGEVPFSGERK